MATWLAVVAAAATILLPGAVTWTTGRATYYGGPSVLGASFDDFRGEGSFGILSFGSCGYTNGDGTLAFARETYAAAADANDDYPGSCGRCYEVRCVSGLVNERPTTPVQIENGFFGGDPGRPYLADIDANFQDSWGRAWPGNDGEAEGVLNVQCWDESKVIRVVIADSCPCTQVLPDGAPGVKAGGETRTQEWCCGSMPHFDLSYWAFEVLAHPVYGAVNIEYRPVDCYSGVQLPLTPGFISKAIYRDVPQPGWSFYPFFANDHQVSVPGIAPSGNGAACVNASPGGGLSFRCRKCERAGYQPFGGATAVRFWIKPNAGSPDPFVSSTPDGELPGLKMFLLNEERQEYCGSEPVLARDVQEDLRSDSWFRVTLPFGLFSCSNESQMDNIAFQNTGERDALFCVADLEIL